MQPWREACDEWVDAYFGLTPVGPNGGPGPGVGEEQVGDEFSDRLGLGINGGSTREPRRHVIAVLPPWLDVAKGELARLVEGDPPVDLVAKRLCDLSGIAGEELREILADHPSIVALEPDRPDEMVEGEHQLHAVALDALGEGAVVGEGGFVEFTAFGFDPGPGCGKAE